MKEGPDTPLYPDEILGRRAPAGAGKQTGIRRVGSAAAMLAESVLRRPLSRRLLSLLSALMLVTGVVLFSWPFVTNLYTDWKQTGLEDALSSPATRRAYITRTIQPGEALTRITIPALDVETVVVEGTSLSALRAGAGHYQETALPCERGNAAIAGHRTTYGKPFAEMQELGPGDRITLETPVGRCTYEVTRRGVFRTTPNDFGVLAQGRGSLLTLTTCDPPGSADYRLIVQAELTSSEFFE